MKIKNSTIIVLFSTVLLIFIALARIKLLADMGDYLGVAKGFADLLISKMRSTHSWFYGIFLSFFLKIIPSYLFIKIINSLGLILNSILLYKITKNRYSLILYAFAPIVWVMSIWISPIIYSSLLLLLAYYLIKKYENNNKKIHFFLSAILLGISTFVWDTMLFISPIFILVFLFNKTFKESLPYIAIVAIISSFRFLLDYYLFNFPFFSLFRVFGGLFLFATKQGAYTSSVTTIIDYLLLFLVISPLIYKLYQKKDRYTTEVIFVTLVFLFLLMNAQYRYSLIIAPFIIMILSKSITKKELFAHCIISVILIALLTNNYFIKTQESYIAEDLLKAEEDFANMVFLAGDKENSDLYMDLAMLYWGNSIKEFISFQDYDLWLRNETNFQKYRYESSPRINEIRKVWLEFGVAKTDNRTYEDVDYQISTKSTTSLKNFKLIKSYNTLHIFKKQA